MAGCTSDTTLLGAEVCLGGSTDPADPLILLVGDSHAGHWAAAFSRTGRDHHVRLAVRFQGNCSSFGFLVENDRQAAECRAYQAETERLYDHPDVSAIVFAEALTSRSEHGDDGRPAEWAAAAAATIDRISNGRFLFGIGYGWNHEEMEHHGVDPRRRRAITREKILACKALWTEDEASFEGEHVRFEASWSWPKPVQEPHPPIVVGASPTELHLRHIVEYGDAWMPIEGRFPAVS